MRLAFFAVPATDPADGAAELNRFLAGHRVLAIDRQLVQGGAGAYWAVAVTHLASGNLESAPIKPGRVDYKAALASADFAARSDLARGRESISEGQLAPAAIPAAMETEVLASIAR